MKKEQVDLAEMGRDFVGFFKTKERRKEIKESKVEVKNTLYNNIIELNLYKQGFKKEQVDKIMEVIKECQNKQNAKFTQE